MTYISTAEAAELYGVSEQAIRKWCCAGKLACVRIGKLWRIEVDEKGKAAHDMDSGTAYDEMLVTSTLGGNFTWIN
ncbi:MAG: helix-turn-helix domain-containing protein [Eggerthellaceae bacterium]|nr:helix-turn-helix domain-containing protein [Eggerthellaceae bacterium]